MRCFLFLYSHIRFIENIVGNIYLPKTFFSWRYLSSIIWAEISAASFFCVRYRFNVYCFIAMKRLKARSSISPFYFLSWEEKLNGQLLWFSESIQLLAQIGSPHHRHLLRYICICKTPAHFWLILQPCLLQEFLSWSAVWARPLCSNPQSQWLMTLC